MTRKVLITGISGTGKTTLFISQIREIQVKQRFIYDHEGSLAPRMGIKPALTLADLDIHLRSGMVCFDPCQLFPGEWETGFRFFTKWAYDRCGESGGDKLVACDELGSISDVHDPSPEIKLMIQTGRRRGIHFLAVSQQPNELHNVVRSQITEINTFFHSEPLVVKYLAAKGFKEESIMKLGKGQFIRRDLLTQTEKNFQIPIDKLGR